MTGSSEALMDISPDSVAYGVPCTAASDQYQTLKLGIILTNNVSASNKSIKPLELYRFKTRESSQFLGLAHNLHSVPILVDIHENERFACYA